MAVIIVISYYSPLFAEDINDINGISGQEVIDANVGKLKKTVPLPSNALNKSREMIREGRYGEALSILFPYLSEPLKYSEEVSDYIAVLIWVGRTDEAIKVYEKLPESFPQRTYLLNNVAKTYYDNKDYKLSSILYQFALEQSPSDKDANCLKLNVTQRENWELR